MTITRPSSDGGDVRDDDDDDDEVVGVPPRLLCMALSSPGWNIIYGSFYVVGTTISFRLSPDPAVFAGEYPPTESTPRRGGV